MALHGISLEDRVPLDACMRMPGQIMFCRTAEQRFCAYGF